MQTIPDVQSRKDERNVDIDHAGVCDLRYPITVLDLANGVQQTIGTLAMSVGVPREFKGTHMSRFLEVLNEHRHSLNIDTLPAIVEKLRARLSAADAKVTVEFPYFIEKLAPVTYSKGLLDYECWFSCEAKGSNVHTVMGVRVPVTSLCPCSKEISDYGAHNQRGTITIAVAPAAPSPILWLEELIALAEQSASCPVYPVLKRPDERHVTMQAFDNPVFVEDMVRNVAVGLEANERVAWYSVQAVNDESIHNHAAFASVERDKRLLY